MKRNLGRELGFGKAKPNPEPSDVTQGPPETDAARLERLPRVLLRYADDLDRYGKPLDSGLGGLLRFATKHIAAPAPVLDAGEIKEWTLKYGRSQLSIFSGLDRWLSISHKPLSSREMGELHELVSLHNREMRLVHAALASLRKRIKELEGTLRELATDDERAEIAEREVL